MGLTKLCLKNPAAVGVMLALIALLGVISITKLPIQLLPNIERPEISIWTGWRAASPREVESEIIEPANGIVTSPLESCDICHGPGRAVDVKTVHDVGIYKFDDLAAN